MRRTHSLGAAWLWTCCAFVLFGLLSSRLFAQAATGCQASPTIQAALDRLPQQPKQRLAALQAMAHKHPTDVYVQQAYINSATSPPADSEARRKVEAEYEALHQQQSENVQIDYLYGLTLVGQDTPGAISLFNAALKADPGFALPHLEFVIIYGSPVFRDQAKRTANLETFLDACPDSLAGYRRLSAFQNKDLLKVYAARLRALLAHRADVDAVRTYPALWTAEFKSHSLAEYAMLRKRVASDVTRLRALHLTTTSAWYTTLEKGYQLVGDAEQQHWASKQLAQLEGRPSFAAADALLQQMGQWSKDHPWPKPGSSHATMQAYYKVLLARVDKLEKRIPKAPSGSSGGWNVAREMVEQNRVRAIENLDNTRPPDLENAVKHMLDALRENGDTFVSGSPYSFLASVVFRKHLDPQLLVKVAQEGLANLDRFPQPSDLYLTREQLAQNRFASADMYAQILTYEARGYLELKDETRAGPILRQLDKSLENQARSAGEKPDWRQIYLLNRFYYWGLMAQLAELEGHKQDAMAYYQTALLTRLGVRRLFTARLNDDFANRAHKLWTSLGGTETAWRTWYAERAAPPPSPPQSSVAKTQHVGTLVSVAGEYWQTADEPLPPFHLTDLHGRAWTLADLKGKETFLNFWAVW